MKSVFLLCAALCLPSASVVAAPVINPTPADFSPLPMVIDDQAIALLDQTVAAYAGAQSLSQAVEWSSRFPDGETLKSRGRWDFQRPNRARLERNTTQARILIVGNGKTLIGQWGDKIAPMEGEAIQQTGEYLFRGPLAPMGLIFRGINPLRFPVDLGWKSATVMPDGKGIIFMVQAHAEAPLEMFHIRLDAQTHLIRFASYQASAVGEEGETLTYSGWVALNPTAAKLTPTTFDFVMPAGQTLESLSPPKYHDPTLVAGAKPFALKGQTLDGQAISLDDYKGKVVLLDFWASWCPPCLDELPVMSATYRKYRDQGFEIIGISRDEEETDLTDFLKKRELPWPMIFDKGVEGANNGETYGVSSDNGDTLPMTFLLGRDGKIIASDLRGWHLPLAVEKALQAPTP